jgi:hypothetical protein
MEETKYTLKDFEELLDMISELNMEDEDNLVGIEELKDIIMLTQNVGKKYKYSGMAGLKAVNSGLRAYIDNKRYKENKLTTYLTWWMKQGVEKELGLGDFA